MLLWGFGLMIFAVLVTGTTLTYKAWAALQHVVTRHSGVSTDALRKDAPPDLELASLKKEGDARVNILLLGVGDPQHAGAGLSDTMLVASIDTKLKTVAMIGIPRDLYVPIPGHGFDKINAAHVYGGPELSKTVVSQALDVPIHYYARLDFTGFKKIVTTMGGVKIDVANNLFDSEYPCDYDERLACGFSIKAGLQTMNGDTALKYVRCRKGNCGNDFGRSSRQQQVLVGLREKASGLSTLTNPALLGSLIDTVGNHARTDISVDEMQTLGQILHDVSSTNITTSVIDGETEKLVNSTSIGGASVVVPNLGVGKFGDIQAFAHKLFIDRYIQSEAARVLIRDGSKAQRGKVLESVLASYNYQVTLESIQTPLASSRLVDSSKATKPYTLKYLQNRLQMTPTEDTTQSGYDIVIELGSDYRP